MRLGGPVFATYADPAAWAREVAALGYRAAYCPVEPSADEATVRAYAREAERADIVIAEVGAWSNPLSADARTRAEARETCVAALALAERIGARCAVNIAGSRGSKWDGPDARDLTEETFGMIVEATRAIIDAVRPTRASYTLETMPWMYPDSVDSYLRLLDAIDRAAFAVHFDPVNLVNCPQRYFGNAALMRDFFARLGPRIRSCHAKDVLLGENLTTHLDEVRLGTGGLDCRAFLHEAAGLDADLPVMLEHLPAEQDYRLAAEHLRGVAREEGLAL
jgi:sugar phosphate isomerase/epimerase